jgi:hypothetical protein
MSKKRKYSGALGKLRQFGPTPINLVAARVVGLGRKQRHDPAELRRRAAGAADLAKRARPVEQAAAAEREKRAELTRLIGPAAERRAKFELDRARWRRENDRD